MTGTPGRGRVISSVVFAAFRLGKTQSTRAVGAVKLVAVGWGQLQMDHYGRVDAASSSLYNGYERDTVRRGRRSSDGLVNSPSHRPLTSNTTARPKPGHLSILHSGQSLHHAAAAKKFFRRLLTGLRYVPRVVVTAKLRSYGATHREVLPSVTHRQSRYLNNRAENSHQPTRQRERAMKRFTSSGHAQRFLFAFSRISPYFQPRRHRLSADATAEK